MALDQARLNVENRTRTSRLPWRGQFSPEFIEYMMETVCADSGSVFDPFCGSGTVLFESAERGLSSWGVEVNPAAWHLAAISEFTSLSYSEKSQLLRYVKTTISEISEQEGSLFQSAITPHDFLSRATNHEADPAIARVIAAAIILGMGNSNIFDASSVQKGLFALAPVLTRALEFEATSQCVLGDARNTGLESEIAESAITSPPYINVFNYHQNYRPAVELLGWRPLQAAQVEIGANRKFRQNRFLTVVQYCIDMQLALEETARVLKPDAPLVIVLGRTSNVLGCSFENGVIIKDLLQSDANFDEVWSAERVFTSRFGERIFEDILVARRVGRATSDPSLAREIGRKALLSAVSNVPDKNRAALMSAIDAAPDVQPSSRLEMDAPPQFVRTERGNENGSRSHRRARG
jgi:hypothetical protein